MSRLAIAAALVVALAAGGCSQSEPPPPPKTVDWYTAHPTERDARIKVCKNDPGTLKNDPDCINASASALANWGKATLPPVTFGAPSSGAAVAASR